MRRIIFALLLLPSLTLGQDSMNVRRLWETVFNWNSSRGLAVSDTIAYVCVESDVVLYDIVDPSHPFEVGRITTPGFALSVTLLGNIALVADYDGGLIVLEVSDPSLPHQIGAFLTPWYARDVAVSGMYAYVTEANLTTGYLLILDISDPQMPFPVGGCHIPDIAQGVAVSEPYAYVASCWSGGLRIIDISDPTAPTTVGIFQTGGNCTDVAVRGNLAYVAARHTGLKIVNVENASAPYLVGFYNTPGLALGIALAGEFACLADDASGLRVVNISDATTPVEVGHYNSSGIAQSIAVSNRLAYLADGEFFSIYDCSAALGVSREPTSFTPVNFSLSSIYPNPFNSTTTIQFELPRQSDVEMNVFDVQGRLTRELVNRVFTAGSHSYMFDAQGLPSGSYFVKLNAEGFQAVKKVVLLK